MQESSCPANCYRSSARTGNRTSYKSPPARRREHCDPSRCNARVGTESLAPEVESRTYRVHHIVNKIQELKRNVLVADESQRRDRRLKDESERSKFFLGQSAADADKTTDLKAVHDAVESCLREMGKIKRFLEDENSWWKILKERTVDCCQQKLPHLHGMLDGSSVTLMLLEDAADEIPRRFATSTPKKSSEVADYSLPISPRALASECVEQCTNPWNEHTEKYTDSYTVPCYGSGMKSTLNEATGIERNDPAQGYVRTDVRGKHMPSEFWTEAQEHKNDRQRSLEWSSRSKGTRDKSQFERKDKRTERINASPREIWYGKTTQITFEDTLKPREMFSSENTESTRHITADFESNVDLNTGLPSRNTASHRPRTVAEKGFTQKSSMKVSKTEAAGSNI